MTDKITKERYQLRICCLLGNFITSPYVVRGLIECYSSSLVCNVCW
jgi:hypothetical protein